MLVPRHFENLNVDLDLWVGPRDLFFADEYLEKLSLEDILSPKKPRHLAFQVSAEFNERRKTSRDTKAQGGVDQLPQEFISELSAAYVELSSLNKSKDFDPLKPKRRISLVCESRTHYDQLVKLIEAFHEV